MLVDLRDVSRSRVAARYLNGKTLRGHTRDFSPNRDVFVLVPLEDGSNGKTITVKVKELKALFFVKDLTTKQRTGRDTPVEKFKPQPSMRRVVVRFLDGEVMAGGAYAYSPDKEGFFLFPLDPTTNNDRVWVVRSSTHVIRALSLTEDLTEVVSEMKAMPAEMK